MQPIPLDKLIKIRIIRNRHGNAIDAYLKWRPNLWGTPIYPGRSRSKIHVAGVNIKSATAVDVEFTDEFITVLRRRPPSPTNP